MSKQVFLLPKLRIGVANANRSHLERPLRSLLGNLLKENRDRMDETAGGVKITVRSRIQKHAKSNQ